MHWLLQRRFEYDRNYLELIRQLQRLGIEHSYCNVVPFSEDGIKFEKDVIPLNKPVFAFGSYTLAKIAKKHYKPGAFISENITIENLLKHYKDEMFNSDAIITTIGEFEPVEDYTFVRPNEDDKCFTGAVFRKDEYLKWRDNLLSIEDYKTISENTKICVACPKPIHNEMRFFIVNSEIITHSNYKYGENVKYSPILNKDYIQYVKEIIEEWEPDTAYCLDIVVYDDDPKILEANCINAVGLYACDKQKFIMGIEKLNRS